MKLYVKRKQYKYKYIYASLKIPVLPTLRKYTFSYFLFILTINDERWRLSKTHTNGYFYFKNDVNC